ncbi:MAG: sugar ABC transporter substrate-binding protein [Caldicoprobacterales bacterium]|jgi:ABC-type sugar transport system substrate-binding protein|nr:sugar ABC transporter substrate-binding protein [Clostridiales bacterium]
MKKIISLILVMALALVVFSGCVSKAPPVEDTAGNSGDTAAPKYKMTFIVKSMAASFFLDVIEGAKAAAKDLNIELNCVGPETPFSVEEQIQIIEQSITDGVDGVIVIPADSEAITTAIEKCNDANIPVVTPNTKANGGDVVTWIGADNVEVGYTLGKIMCESINGKGNVVLLEGTPGNSTAEERTEGYKKAIDEYPDVVLLDSQPANFEREAGMTLMENFLQMYDNIDACGSGNKDMTMGAIEAAKNANRLEEIKFITFDTDEDVIAGIQSGEVFATGNQDPFSQGYLSVAAMFAHLGGCRLPSIMHLPMKVIDSTNIDDFVASQN